MLDRRASGFFLREDLEGVSEPLLRSMIEHSDDGVVLTDGGRGILAANSRFGELFAVPMESFVRSNDVGALRDLLHDRMLSAGYLLDSLDEVFRDPSRAWEDQVELRDPRRSLRFATVPVLEGERWIGRLWTFRDVTATKRLGEMHRALYDVSVFVDPDPWRVCDFVVETLSAYYGTRGVMGLLRDDFLEYRAAGPPLLEAELAGVPLERSICRLPIESLRPTLVPSVMGDPRTRDTAPAHGGVRAYMGFPLLSAQGTVRGTLALMAGSETPPLDDEDLRFLSTLGMRVASELERARITETQVAAQQSVVDAQAADLTETREVLDAMVHAFDLVSFDEPIETVLVAQAALLQNLLGFGTVAILSTRGAGDSAVLATPYEHRTLPTTEAFDDIRRMGWARRDALRQIGLEGFAEGLAVPLGSESRSFGFLIYEAERRAEIDEHRRIHLEAIAEQVALTLEAYSLRAELVSAAKMAEARESEAVLSARLATAGLLAATVAHDVKNIVAAISLELASTSEPLRTLTAVRTHMDRFGVLSHRLLSYAKPRMVVKRPVDLDDLLRRVAGLFADHLRISDIQLVLAPAKAPTFVQGDPHQLEHLFANLVLNSIQAMSARSGGLIEIRVRRQGKKAVVDVRDTGPGLKDENLDKMFEPFVGFRHEGFGLGLFSARRIASEHGGDVKAASTPGVGTTVTVTLQASPTEP